MPTGAVTWCSTAGETSWAPPFISDWRSETSEDGDLFYFNSITEKSTWETPEELAWEEAHGEEHDRAFWFNSQSKATQWTKPAVLAWSMKRIV